MSLIQNSLLISQKCLQKNKVNIFVTSDGEEIDIWEQIDGKKQKNKLSWTLIFKNK